MEFASTCSELDETYVACSFRSSHLVHIMSAGFPRSSATSFFVVLVGLLGAQSCTWSRMNHRHLRTVSNSARFISLGIAE